MKIEHKINRLISNVPFLKKSVKRTYQILNYLSSDRKKMDGNIFNLTPEVDDGFEYFFGYYDKTPWNFDDTQVLCLRVKSTTKELDSNEDAEIILIDTENENNFTVIGKTNAWNIQQGCMLQWRGPNYKQEILFNDFRNNSLCTVIYNLESKEEKVLKKPSYSISSKGDFSITLDFERLHHFRPGYGYKTNNVTIFENYGGCIWKVDYLNNEVTELMDFEKLISFQPKVSMENSIHKVNHIMLNPSNDRFMFLHRWINKGKKYTRLLTFNLITSELKIINDDDMISHCCWKNENTIMGFMNKKYCGEGYYLINEESMKVERLISKVNVDGHPSYSPKKNNQFITDTYPNRQRKSSIYLIDENQNVKTVAQVFAPFKYDNEFRCDLHPRWNRNGTKIAFDSVHHGKRGLYYIKL